MTKICSHCDWDNHENATAVVGNCSLDHDSRCKSSASSPPTVWVQLDSNGDANLSPMARSQQNTCYRVSHSELSLK
ncbi:hypothetical protein TNCV_3049741 [Trichonephila clavipes]|nr:hypothetical protein TNCV_3049741 [Trichonephila clavipes]